MLCSYRRPRSFWIPGLSGQHDFSGDVQLLELSCFFIWLEQIIYSGKTLVSVEFLKWIDVKLYLLFNEVYGTVDRCLSICSWCISCIAFRYDYLNFRPSLVIECLANEAPWCIISGDDFLVLFDKGFLWMILC